MQAVIRETEKKKEKNFYVEKSAQELEVKFLVDFINKRLKIIKYRCNDYDMLCREIDRMAKKYNLTKILLTAKEDDWQKFFVRDFILESLHPALFSGQPGYHMSQFTSIDRLKSDVYFLEKNILKKIQESYPHKLKKIADAYIIDNVKDNDINQLLNLYKTVFTTYPTPINDREYLKKSLFSLAFCINSSVNITEMFAPVTLVRSSLIETNLKISGCCTDNSNIKAPRRPS